MTENEFLLADRLQKIVATNSKLNFADCGYISFSGGKDSTVLHYLMDEALPNNQIPRVFINTGLEYKAIVEYIKNLAKNDKRFVIVNQTVNIMKTLREWGFPFKSKNHARRVWQFNRGINKNVVEKYIAQIGNYSTLYSCPKILRYQFVEQGKYNYSDFCCTKLKKDLARKWELDNDRKICITGMRRAEKGNRAKIDCLSHNNTRFNPLAPVTDDFEEWLIKTLDIKLCKLYYTPYNILRTGCIGCPFNIHIQDDLKMLKQLLPTEHKRALLLFGDVYKEYARIGYRIKDMSVLEL